MYGAQTFCVACPRPTKFENDVEMYGAQTLDLILCENNWFENDVEMYGAQTTNPTSHKTQFV